MAIVLLSTALLRSGCLGVYAVLLCCWGRGGGGAWRLGCYLQHFCSPAALVCVLCCCSAGIVEVVRGDCATISSISAVRLPWYVCCVVVLLGWGSSWCVTIVLLFTALLLSSCLGVCAVLLCC